MKKRNFLIVLILALFTVSCSSSGYVFVDYPQDPALKLPEDIHDIAVVNRSLTNDEDNSAKTLESIVTGEIAGSDKLASDVAIKGVFDGVQNKSQLRIVIPPTMRLEGTGTREIPDVLSWNEVNEICSETNADLLLVLETFDSNSDFALNTAVDQITSVIQTGKPSGRIPRRARLNVMSYWRLYDPYSKTIVDQFQQNQFMDFDVANGLLPFNALSETAYAAGLEYSSRFFPGYYRVKRDMYKKGKGSDKNLFKMGWRSSEVANWDEAIDIWTGIANNFTSKSAGRAALNVAVAYEVLGQTDLALQWAQRAYEAYGDKLARDYANILRRRQQLEF